MRVRKVKVSTECTIPAPKISNLEVETTIENGLAVQETKVVDAHELGAAELAAPNNSNTAQLYFSQLRWDDRLFLILDSSIWNYILDIFKLLAFEYTFVSRKKYLEKGQPRFVVTNVLFNKGVLMMKQQLVNIIKDSIGKTLITPNGKPLYDGDYMIFDSRGANEANWIRLMLACKSFIKDFKLDGNLDDSKYKLKIKAFSAIYILNNFDHFFEENMKGFGSIEKSFYKGKLQNAIYTKAKNYSKEVFWNQTDLEYGSAPKNISHTAKFLISMMPVVYYDKDGNNPRIIEGDHLRESDLMAFSSTINEALIEYMLNNTEEEFTSLLSDPYSLVEKILKDLLLKETKHNKRVMDSFRYFLYDDSLEVSLRSLNIEALRLGILITDFEGALIHEVLKNTTPTYLSFSEKAKLSDNDKFTKDRVLAKSKEFKYSFKLNNNLVDYIAANLINETPTITEVLIEEWKNPEKDLHNNKSYINFIESILGIDTKFGAYELLFDRNDVMCQKMLELAEKINISTVDLNNKNGDPFINSDNIINQIRSNRDWWNDFYELMNPLVSLSVSTTVKRGEATLPIYRLLTAFDAILHQVSTYKSPTLGGSYVNAKKLNLFVANPLLVTKYNDKVTKSINAVYNSSTGIKLGIDTEDLSVDFRKLSTFDQLATSFIGEFASLQNIKQRYTEITGSMFGVLPASYSDKSTILSVLINLDTKLDLTPLGILDIHGNQITTTSFSLILQMPNSEDILYSIDYYYRRNKTIALLYKMLEDWNKLLNLNLSLPDINTVINSNVNKDCSEIIDQLLNLTKYVNSKINEFLEVRLENDKIKINRSKRQALFNMASILSIDICELMHYRGYLDKILIGDYSFDNLLGINRLVLNEVYNLRDLNNFKIYLDSQFDELRNSKISLLKNVNSGRKKYKILQSTGFYNALKNKIRERVSDDRAEFGRDEEFDLNFKLMFNLWCLLDNIITHQFLDLFGKQSWEDPAKEATSTIEAETNASYSTGCKRNNMYTATFIPYLQKTLSGVSQSFKAAVIEDLRAETFNPLGDKHDLDIYDGCSMVNPIAMRMLYASLLRDFNTSLKSIGTSANTFFACLCKWAEFTLTNFAIRNNKNCAQYRLFGEQKKNFNLKQMFKKMFSDFDTENIDICKDYSGRYWISDFLRETPIYRTDGVRLIKILSIKRVSENEYEITELLVDNEGKVKKDILLPKRTVLINSLYDLWEAFGGEYCMEKTGKTLQFSENNMELIYQAVIKVGNIKPEFLEAYNRGELKLDLNTVNQPLRGTFISHLINASAIKRGACNINSSDVWFDDNLQLNTFSIDTRLFGQLMDASHETDLSTIASPTQAISALALNGYTKEQANRVYLMIKTSIEKKLRESGMLVNGRQDTTYSKVAETLSSILVLSLSFDGTISMSSDILNAILLLVTEGNIILPFSDRYFSGEFVKNMLSDLNSEMIRLRLTGTGSVLNPSDHIYGIFKIGEDRLLYEELLNKARTAAYNGDLSEVFEAIEDHPEWDLDEKIQYLVNSYILSVVPNASLYNNEIIVPVSEDYHADALDTVLIVDKNGKLELLTLDTQKNIRKYIDYKTAYENHEIDTPPYLVLTKPHDLGSLKIITVSKEVIDGEERTIVESDYISEFSKLFMTDIDEDFAINKQRIEELLLILKENGLAINENCK